MKIIITSLFLFLTCTLSIYSQNIETLLHHIETKNPEELKLIQKTANIYSNENYSYGIRYLKKSLKRHGTFYDGLLFIAYGYRKQKKYDKSIKYFNQAVTKQPKSALGYFLRGNTYLDVKKYRSALQDYKTCIKQDYRFYQAYNNMAILKVANQGGSGNIHKNDFKHAEKILGSILSCDEDKSAMEKIYFNLGLVQLNLNQYSEALCFFNKAVTLHEIKANALFYRGVSNFKLKSFKEAKADFKEAKTLGFKVKDCDDYLLLINRLSQ